MFVNNFSKVFSFPKLAEQEVSVWKLTFATTKTERFGAKSPRTRAST